MDEIVAKLSEGFNLFIIKEQLFGNQDSILIAISGGIDSVVMAHLFAQSSYQFGIVHCHFGLREEANEEAVFVENLAKKFQVPFYFKKFDTLAYAERQKISIQMAARELRYNFFEEIRQQHQYNYIATAHHLNDSLETTLYNLSKGTGIAGLRGILPKRDKIVRPLLFSSRRQIENFAHQNGILWMEDVSNASDKYARNAIRHHVIPALETLNSNLLHTFSETMMRLQSVEKVYQERIELLKEKFLQKKGQVTYLQLDESIDTPLLYEILRKYGFSFRQCQQIADCKETGSDFYAAYWAVWDRNQLVIVPSDFQKKTEEVYTLNVNENIENQFFKIKSELINNENIIFEKNNNQVVYLDAEKLEFPLKIRVWEQGDTFQPLGMKGKQKVSDFLINQKISKNLKNRIFVVISGEKIAYIAGLRSSEAFKITSQTQKVLKLTFVPQ
ncbi:MAG: tRNA lysidine(34) synthetase TilS [Raineya sp.]|jgi:tRNA(Ile)-lysidine synthase|nr:tRNA lysidine(34) synthetase TilS [Raineya sp.]